MKSFVSVCCNTLGGSSIHLLPTLSAPPTHSHSTHPNHHSPHNYTNMGRGVAWTAIKTADLARASIAVSGDTIYCIDQTSHHFNNGM